MTAFTIGALSMIGVPPTGGFVSKYILAGALQADNYVAVATIIASTVLNAAYFLPIVFAAWFGRERAPAGGNRANDHGWTDAGFIPVQRACDRIASPDFRGS